jgi:hypothetical protein
MSFIHAVTISCRRWPCEQKIDSLPGFMDCWRHKCARNELCDFVKACDKVFGSLHPSHVGHSASPEEHLMHTIFQESASNP